MPTLDPPYNTKSAFEHYDDNLEHSQWLTMMLPRLQFLRVFLREDGSIWVTLDDNEGHYLKVLMDEVFGRIPPRRFAQLREPFQLISSTLHPGLPRSDWYGAWGQVSRTLQPAPSWWWPRCRASASKTPSSATSTPSARR